MPSKLMNRPWFMGWQVPDSGCAFRISLAALVLVDGAIVLVEAAAELAAAVAARDEVQSLAGRRLHRGQQRRFARHRNGGGRQSRMHVGVPGGVGQQVLL